MILPIAGAHFQDVLITMYVFVLVGVKPQITKTNQTVNVATAKSQIYVRHNLMLVLGAQILVTVITTNHLNKGHN